MPLTPQFAARLAADVTQLCACWRFTRRDGRIFGATDHDRTIKLDGFSYLPAHGLAASALDSSSDLSPGRASVEGALDLEFIEEADVLAGLWDGARVDVWRVDWAEPQNRVQVWAGRLSEVRRAGAGFAAELLSLKVDLERPIGRIYGRSCDATLGDARCGVDLAAWAATNGVATSGQPITCDRSFATCREKFANSTNFRGFPYLPGEDAVLAGPAAGGVHTGGSRS